MDSPDDKIGGGEQVSAVLTRSNGSKRFILPRIRLTRRFVSAVKAVLRLFSS